MKIINFLAIAVICASCAKITTQTSGGGAQITPKTNYPKVALSSTNLNGSWIWACHADNLLNLPDGKGFIETTTISGGSFDSIIQVYSDAGCISNAYTFKYTASFLLAINPASMVETRTQFSLIPLSDATQKLLVDVAGQGKNAFCNDVGWTVGVEVAQFFSMCNLPAAATRNITLFSNGLNSEMILSSCTTASNCVNADYLSK